MENTFSKKSHKTLFICGDFNIDLLNPNNHKMTEEFINTMHSLSLYPKITRPSRITTHCAKLIDNIFTNYIEDNTVNGLLINDISDHLPVFIVYECNYKRDKPDMNIEYRRLRSEESINEFKKDLLAQNWENVYKENDANGAYDVFIAAFVSLYDKNCPVRWFK